MQDANASFISRAWERTVARFFCGPPRPEAEWVEAGNAGQMRFIARHGILFEDNRGAPLLQTTVLTFARGAGLLSRRV